MRKLLFTAWLLAGCRFGGPGGDALRLVEPERDAGEDAAVMDASSFPPVDGGQVVPAPPRPDAALPDASSDSGSDARAEDEGGRCPALIFAGCDPVQNTSCSDGLTQCVLDPSLSSPTGRCIFSSPAATPCSESSISTSCAPRQTCVAGTCRKYCACDADCDPGERCGDPIEGAASDVVKLCRASVE